MIKWYILLFVCYFMVCHNQSILLDKSQICDCNDLLNEMDCNQKDGCQWTIDKNSSINNSTSRYTCTKFNTQSDAKFSKCFLIESQQNCSQTFGCSYFNNTCQIFSGCTYVKQSNMECQQISLQCTSNNINCINIRECKNYETEQQCSYNVATSGAKSCKWIEGKCLDKLCEDYPNNQPNQQQCSNWITNCLSNGKGCVNKLQSCDQYNSTNCEGWIGIDDAPLSHSSNQQCNQFLNSCITTGRGCVSQLQSCNTYKQSQGCSNLIGSDGNCIDDEISQQKNCRAITCNDAPITMNSNRQCNLFLSGCITNRLGCRQKLDSCSTYRGNQDLCSKYIGSDGKCLGKSNNEEQCQSRLCSDAPNTLRSNKECDEFQLGCITNGYGCTTVLQQCDQYQIQDEVCNQLIGVEGNCYLDIQQTSNYKCKTKICEDAPKTFNKNQQCKQYSYNCVTNGFGCVKIQQCEITSQQISCEGSNNCALINKCIDMRQCSNYQTKSECQLNNQQQQTVDGDIFERKCIWINNQCTNSQCNSFSANSDKKCSELLKGCLSDGNTCVDIDAPCDAYKGNTQQCQKYKGNNDKSQCTQLFNEKNEAAACISKSCNIAKYIIAQISSNQTCQEYLNGCYFDGRDNCTDGDCSNYFGTQQYCSQISTAKYQGVMQKCWKNIEIYTVSQCSIRRCSDAPLNNYQNDEQCNQFLIGCVSNGKGLCISNTTACTEYSGTKQQCQLFKSPQGQCTKNANCQQVQCENQEIPINQINDQEKRQFCQTIIDFYRTNCSWQTGNRCISPNSCNDYIAIGQDSTSQSIYCQNLRSNHNQCGYSSGNSCVAVNKCSDLITPQGTQEQKMNYCSKIKINQQICGMLQNQNTCSTKSCNDYGLINQTLCTNYLSECQFNIFANSCYQMINLCTIYQIPNNLKELKDKQQYCQGFKINQQQNCIYNLEASSTCSIPQLCTSYSLTSLDTHYQKAEYCGLLKNILNKQCGYSVSDTRCIELGVCQDYKTSLETDLIAQQICQLNIDINGYVCNYKSGDLYCSSPQSKCSDYHVYGFDIVTNKKFCQNLYTVGQTQQCDYVTQSFVCQNLICSEIQSQSSCQIQCENIPFPSESLSQTQSAMFCQQQMNNKQENCYYQSNNCLKPQFCNDFITFGNDFNEKLEYCKKLTIIESTATESIQCGYISGDTCKSCGQIIPPEGTNESKYNYCSQKTIDGINYCGFQENTEQCQAKSCTDYGLDTPIICESYLQSCKFNKNTFQCYQMKDNCEDYLVQLDKFNYFYNQYYCFGLIAKNSPNSCIVPRQQSGYCSTFVSCQTYSFSANYCSLIRNTNGQICHYNENEQTCTDIPQPKISCNAYLVIYTQYINKQFFCTNQIDKDGYVCGSDLFYCQAPQKKCKNYQAFGSFEQRSNYCSRLKTNSSPSFQCDYVGSENYCSNKGCDINFNSLITCDITTCSIGTFNNQFTNQVQKQLSCQQYKDQDLNNCSWEEGQGFCYNPINCNNFVAYGQNQIEKQNYCKFLSTLYFDYCGYYIGLNCADCGLIIPSKRSDYKQSKFCSSISIDGENYCGFVAGKSNCSRKQCFDYGLINSTLCKNYLPYCDFSVISNQCYLIVNICQNQLIPEHYNKFQERLTFCTTMKIDNPNFSRCTYERQFDRCLPTLANCTQIKLVANYNACLGQTNYQGIKCQHSFMDNNCVSKKQCDYFKTSPNKISNLDDQQYCQQHQDQDDFTCNYKQGDTYCQTPQSNCTDYQVYGGDININRVLCQNLFTKSNPTIQCDYGTSGQICQDLNCSTYIGTQSLCQTKLCDTVSNQNLASVQQKAFYCQQWQNAQSSNCAYINSNVCAVSTLCNQYLAYGTDLQIKKTYCSNIVLQNQQNCGYISGDTCTSCSLIQVQGSSDIQKYTFCTTLDLVCSYQIGEQYCSDLICEDFSLVNQNDCQSQPTCEFNFNWNICYKKRSDCSKYTIPYSIQGSEYNRQSQYCSGFQILNSSIPCIFDPANSETCSSPKECSSIQGIYQMCSLTNNITGVLCVLNQLNQKCQNLDQCQNYIYSPNISDLHFQYRGYHPEIPAYLHIWSLSSFHLSFKNLSFNKSFQSSIISPQFIYLNLMQKKINFGSFYNILISFQNIKFKLCSHIYDNIQKYEFHYKK